MPLISGSLAAASQFQANEYNKQINQANNAFNAQQSEIQRQWQAGQDALNREFNMTEAQKVRDFEERMSNTSMQRAFADAKAAGINPVAAVLGQGGASTPSVAAASGSAGNYDAANAAHPLSAKGVDYTKISDGLASVASSAASLAAIKKFGTIKDVADVSKILTSAKTAKSIASIAKFLV